MNYETTLSDRVKSIIGNNISAFSRKSGLSESLLRQYISGSKPGLDKAVAMARTGNVSLEWLATGKGQMQAGNVQESNPKHEIGPEFNLVPQYDVEASAGAGRIVERESEIGKLAFRRDWIEKKCLSAKDLVVIRITGDSMSPTIRDGSLALVDTRQGRVQEDGIYVLMVDGHLIAKRLQTDFRGGVYIRSDNQAYRDEHLKAEEASSLYITGRVVWSGGEL